MIPTLVTIPFSHFCEKARWALDRSGVQYREEAHLPGLHRAATARHAGRSVPVLVTEGGVLRQSSDILRFAEERTPTDRRMVPPAHREEIEAMIARFDREVGPSTRLLAYHYLLPHVKTLVGFVAPSFSRVDRWKLRVLLPLMRPMMRRAMKITSKNAERSITILRRCFADVSEQLRDGFLVGGTFTAADLTFAALAAPVILPVGHGYQASDASALPPPFRTLFEELRATPAGAHVAEMYRTHRR